MMMPSIMWPEKKFREVKNEGVAGEAPKIAR